MRKRGRLQGGRKPFTGYLFTLPFLFGFVVLFLPAVVDSVVYMFSEVTVELGSVNVKFVGWDNFKQAFLVNTEFRVLLTEGFRAMLFDTVQIMIFSFFIANILNQAFIGRSIARTIFFLPVIISTGIVASTFSASDKYNPVTLATTVQESSLNLGGSDGVLSMLEGFLIDMTWNINNGQFTNMLMSAVENTFTTINSSGVQIMVFLMALRSINPSIFESSKVEGATKWEEFWKITFPLITPMIFVNVVYTVIDSFTNPIYGIQEYIRLQAFSMGKMGFASALSWIYFVVTLLILGVCSLVFNRYTVYLDN